MGVTRIVIALFIFTLNSSLAFATDEDGQFTTRQTASSVTVESSWTPDVSMTPEQLDELIAKSIKASSPIKRMSIGGRKDLPPSSDNSGQDTLIYYFLKPGIKNLPEVLLTFRRNISGNTTTYTLVSPLNFYNNYFEMRQQHLSVRHISLNMIFSGTTLTSTFEINFPQFEGWLTQFLQPVNLPHRNRLSHASIQMTDILNGMQSMLKGLHLNLTN